MSEVAVMKDAAAVDHKDCRAQKELEELEAHSESNQLSPLLCDFVRELLKQRLLRRVEFVRVIELSRRE
jgi:hypothetical protein